MIIDTHCHYNLSPLLESWQNHWQTAQAKGINGSVVVGTTVESSKKAIEIASQDPKLFAAVGIHPNEPQYSSLATTPEAWSSHLAELTSLVTDKKVIAIGETGLDYFRLPETSVESIKVLQKYLLEQQIALAAAHMLPVIIHLRDRTDQAYWDFLEIIKAVPQAPPMFILHCVSGPLEYVTECLELGAYFGVAGNSTYKNADQLHAIIETVPKERIVLETDAPFLPPTPHRGKSCEPWMIDLTARFLQDQYQLDLDQVIENTYQVFPAFKASL